MAGPYRVRFKNSSTKKVFYVGLRSQGVFVEGLLNPGTRQDYVTPGNLLNEGPRVIAVFDQDGFPPGPLDAKIIDINHDYFIVEITDTGIVTYYSSTGSFPP